MRIKTIIILIAQIMLLALAGCSKSTVDNADNTYQHLEADEATERIEANECILIDVRKKDEYVMEHIPGAINVPYDSDDEAFAAVIPDKDTEIILYCDYGGISKDTAEHLCKDLGYTHVSEFDGLLVWEGDTVSGE